jgi:hypothetical protein
MTTTPMGVGSFLRGEVKEMRKMDLPAHKRALWSRIEQLCARLDRLNICGCSRARLLYLIAKYSVELQAED